MLFCIRVGVSSFPWNRRQSSICRCSRDSPNRAAETAQRDVVVYPSSSRGLRWQSLSDGSADTCDVRERARPVRSWPSIRGRDGNDVCGGRGPRANDAATAVRPDARWVGSQAHRRERSVILDMDSDVAQFEEREISEGHPVRRRAGRTQYLSQWDQTEWPSYLSLWDGYMEDQSL